MTSPTVFDVMAMIRPWPLALSCGRNAWGHDEHGVDVEQHHPAPVLIRHPVEHLVGVDAGVVHQDLGRAQRGPHLVRGPGDLLRLGDVHLERDALRARHHVRGVRDVQHGDRGALGREALRVHPADAVGAAGDHGDPAVEAAHAATRESPAAIRRIAVSVAATALR
jgi:hypothetical protein